MQGKYLMVLEVSQKQSYIFNEKRLQNNILASDTIAYVTSTEFFQSEFPHLYSESDNMIYAGGGHTFLVFDSEKKATDFAKAVSYYVLKEFPGLELFIRVQKYNTEKTPNENIRQLTNALEEKKGLRKASFFQTTFGLEKSGRRMSLSEGREDGSMRLITPEISKKVEDATWASAEKKKGNETVDIETPPDGFSFPYQFEKLGGEKGKNNFIAVVHIDGNQMGQRVMGLQNCIDADEEGIGKKLSVSHPEYSKSRKDFEIWRYYNRKFSESIDFDFKKALQGLFSDLAANIDDSSNEIHELKLARNSGFPVLPIRKIIAAGDDICFVTEGRIGLECAEHFIHYLEQQTNAVDHKNYYACAGVAIVHQKYPFYRAYDMAEQLCSKAKKVMADRAKKEGRAIGTLSAIDWHVEYGEMQADLDDIRDTLVPEYKPDPSDTLSYDKLYARPYQITDSTDLAHKEGKIAYRYENYRTLQLALQGYSGKGIPKLDISRHKQKAMRSAIKTGYKEYQRFLKMNGIDADHLALIADAPEIFDALETGDLFIPLERREEE